MITYYYDIYGWLSDAEIPGRSTDVAPPPETETLKANWTGEAWVLREWAAPSPLSGPAPAARSISVGAFFDRFGPAKWGVLADISPLVQAVIKDASVRAYIDLENPDLPAGLALIAAAGHDIDADAILSAPVHEGEWP